MQRIRLLNICSVALVLLAPHATMAEQERVEKVYFNARVWTGDPSQAFAEAIAVSGDRVVAVGSSGSILASAGEATQRIDLDGKFVTPGFIDCHVHFFWASLDLISVNLRSAASPVEFTQRIGERAMQRPGEWILHGSWDHERWGGALPDRAWIDDVTNDTPVFVQRTDGHMALANSAALAAAGIGDDMPDPEGGIIIRDADGRATGILKDNAMRLVEKIIPAPSDALMDEALALGVAHALSLGVTQIHDVSDGNWRAFETFRRNHAENKLGLRVYSLVPLADWQKMRDYIEQNGAGDHWLRWGGVKGFVDGSLGSSTAWFYAPYADDPTNSGLVVEDLSVLEEQISAADNAGLQVAMHAIGDRANDATLDIFSKIAKKNPTRDRRFRIEHAQHLATHAISRFKELNVAASMQPFHAIDDGRWAESRIGKERLKEAYVFKSLVRHDARLALGSDWPVAPLDPMAGIDAAVNRRTLDGKHPHGWQPQERITVEEALTAYTVNNAWLGFQEGMLGKIAPGFLADFVVLSDDLLQMNPENIGDVVVERTVLGGKDVYRRAKQASLP